MTHQVAWLMPIYPPHFRFARKFLRSFIKHKFNLQSDLVFVFTSEDEKNIFGDNKYTHSMILPEQLRIFSNKGIINIKKFYALSALLQSGTTYEYIIVLDAESELIKSVNLIDVCRSWFNKKTLYGNTARSDVKLIVDAAKKFFSGHQNISKLDSELYLWFNQPCIYKVSNLAHFFNCIGLSEKIKELTWYDFDYYIYMFYLLLFEDFVIDDMAITADFGALESRQITFHGDKYKQQHFLCCNEMIYDQIPNEEIFFFMQKDKGPGGRRKFLRKPLARLSAVKKWCHAFINKKQGYDRMRLLLTK